jgi:hypothetical protein
MSLLRLVSNSTPRIFTVWFLNVIGVPPVQRFVPGGDFAAKFLLVHHTIRMYHMAVNWSGAGFLSLYP